MSSTSGVNKVFLVGRVETPPRKHIGGNGENRMHFTLSTKEPVKKGNHMSEHTELHHVFIDCAHHDIQAVELSKGALLHIIGKIQTKIITDGDGVKQYKTEVMVQQLTLLSLPVEVSI
jgi:single-strand DNA-binding protein